jgi:DNA-binding transcriptional MerR regulator
MPLSRSRDYLSIGEVLDTLRSDFPDISISKIRFLESEGLITPERTQSGYRKFYEPDLARLRYILSLQRDHFLPLKVIRQRLEQADSNGGALPAAHEPPPAKKGAKGPKSQKSQAPPPPAAVEMAAVQMSRPELCKASGLSEEQLGSLEDFGLLGASEGGSYDENDLLVAKSARKFFDYGVEARHLRMYRQFAEREANFFEQIVAPGTRRRDPNAQSEASQAVRELAALSRQIKEAALRSSLRELL